MSVCVYLSINMYVCILTLWVKVATHQVLQTAQVQVFTCTCHSCLSLGTLPHTPFA